MLLRETVLGERILEIDGVDYRFDKNNAFRGYIETGKSVKGYVKNRDIVIYSVIVTSGDTGVSVSRFESTESGVSHKKSNKFYLKSELNEKVTKKLKSNPKLLFHSKIDIGEKTVQYLYVLAR